MLGAGDYFVASFFGSLVASLRLSLASSFVLALAVLGLVLFVVFVADVPLPGSAFSVVAPVLPFGSAFSVPEFGAWANTLSAKADATSAASSFFNMESPVIDDDPVGICVKQRASPLAVDARVKPLP